MSVDECLKNNIGNRRFSPRKGLPYCTLHKPQEGILPECPYIGIKRVLDLGYEHVNLREVYLCWKGDDN